jgi:ribosome-associated heat shock protein Hsp15
LQITDIALQILGPRHSLHQRSDHLDLTARDHHPSWCTQGPADARLTVWNHGAVEATRIDRWLWAVRLCKTRSAATEACRAGHVRINGSRAKPASSVKAGDTVEARLHARDRVVDVVKVIDTRVGAPLAAECLVDRSPPPPAAADATVARRDRGAGRPSKRERRQLDRTRGRR